MLGKTLYRECTTTGLGPGTLGFYEAERDGEKIVIYGSKWKREYRITGSWDAPARRLGPSFIVPSRIITLSVKNLFRAADYDPGQRYELPGLPSGLRVTIADAKVTDRLSPQLQRLPAPCAPVLRLERWNYLVAGTVLWGPLHCHRSVFRQRRSQSGFNVVVARAQPSDCAGRTAEGSCPHMSVSRNCKATPVILSVVKSAGALLH